MKKIKLFLIRFIARKHIKFITEQDVLRIVNRNLYLGDNKLSDEEIGILKEESGSFKFNAMEIYEKECRVSGHYENGQAG